MNCHIRDVGGSLVNTDLYLKVEDLETYEVTSTTPITVNGKLSFPTGGF